MSEINLPKLPKGKEFEEYVSSFFQCAGFYIERNLIDRQEKEVLELDIISTQYFKDDIPKISLLEAKSGGWGFPDIFKVRGWLDYLNLPSGMLIVQKERKNSELYRSIAQTLGITVIELPVIKKIKKFFKRQLGLNNVDETDIDSWRFSYWVERNLINRLRSQRKMKKTKKAYKQLERYYFLLNSRVFFTQNVVSRAQKLYSTFQVFPNISSKLGNELIDNDFDEDYDSLPFEIYKNTYYDVDLNDIAISTFIEHRARLSIFKSAIDYKIYKEAGLTEKYQKTLKISGIKYDLDLLKILPLSFKKGLGKISKHKYFHLYPVFWQWFLWIFGGFLLKDYKDKEFELLSSKTGIPVDEIPNALESYGLLFPMQDGWFLDLAPNSQIQMMKMFPTPFMGVGANFRRLAYTKEGKYKDLDLTGQHTTNDLIKWNNVTYKLLKKKY